MTSLEYMSSYNFYMAENQQTTKDEFNYDWIYLCILLMSWQSLMNNKIKVHIIHKLLYIYSIIFNFILTKLKNYVIIKVFTNLYSTNSNDLMS